MITPWGESETLRDRRLAPGPGTSSATVAANQRERLFAAMVAVVASRGYERTRVADLVKLSGVSSRSFYALFADKDACALATLDAILAPAAREVAAVADPSVPWERQLRAACDAFAAMVSAQPAAATFALCASYAIGPSARQSLAEAEDQLVVLAQETLGQGSMESAMPVELLLAQLGALGEVARRFLREGRPEELAAVVPDLVDVFLRCGPPPVPLRRVRRSTVPEEDSGGHDDVERALRGVALAAAERGFAGATVQDISRHGSMSPSTFYACFPNKSEALLAAVETTMTQLLSVATSAYQREADWPAAVRAAIGSMLGYLASRPAMAKLVAVEVFAGGGDPQALVSAGARPLHRLLAKGGEIAPDVPPIAAEAIAGAVAALVRRQLLDRGASALPSLAPVATYMALAPFLGPEGAAAGANGQRRSPARGERSPRLERFLADPPSNQSILTLLLSRKPKTTTELAELGVPRAELDAHLEELHRIGAVERIAPSTPGGPVEWRSSKELRAYDGEEWASFTQAERERIAREWMDVTVTDLERSISLGTFVRRLDHYASRTTLRVDEQGWRELGDLHYATSRAVKEIQLRSLDRMKDSDEPAIVGRNVQVLFELPEAETPSEDAPWYQEGSTR